MSSEEVRDQSYRHKYLRDLRQMARKCFTEHEVTEVGPGHWIFKRPGSSTYACHVVVGYGAVVTWGDIGPCGWQYGPADPVGALGWVANMRGSYLEEKAGIFARRGRANTLEFDSGALEADLKEFRASLEESIEEEYGGYDEDDEDGTYAEAMAAVEEAFDEWEIGRLESSRDVYRYFAEDGGYEALYPYFSDLWEMVEPYTGEVLRSDVIYCQEAVAALYKALKGDEDASEDV